MASLPGLPSPFKYTRQALRGLKAVEPLKMRLRIQGRIEKLAKKSIPAGAKKLSGVEHDGDAVHRLRIGDYRVLYVAKENPGEIIVLDVGHRRNVYRKR